MELVLRQAGGSFDDEAGEWGLAPRTARLLFVLPFVGGGVLALVALFDRRMIKFVLRSVSRPRSPSSSP